MTTNWNDDNKEAMEINDDPLRKSILKDKFSNPGCAISQSVEAKAKRGKVLIPMKCPGSKCWFLKHAKKFLGEWRPDTIVEPFAGSGLVGLTLLSEDYTQRLVLAEIDDRRIAFWNRVFDPDFADLVEGWSATVLGLPLEEQRPFVLDSLEEFQRSDLGIWALIYSRVSFSGRMDGGLIRKGDHGRGCMSRWRNDIVPMLRRLYELRDRIEVRCQDGLEVLREFESPKNYAFVDPPYSAGESSKGATLYLHHELDHPALFRLMSAWKGRWQMTWDSCAATLALVEGDELWTLAGETPALVCQPQLRVGNGVLMVPVASHFDFVRMLTGNNRWKYEMVVTNAGSFSEIPSSEGVISASDIS